MDFKRGSLHTFQAEGKATKTRRGFVLGVLHLWLPCGSVNIIWKRGQRTPNPVRMLPFVLGNPSRLTKIKHFLKKKIIIQSFPKFQNIHVASTTWWLTTIKPILFQRISLPSPASRGPWHAHGAQTYMQAKYS